MSELGYEAWSMQNPALGATLMWRFACGYSPQGGAKGTPIPLLFLALPILLHRATADCVTGTMMGSGLRKFEEKFSRSGDVLLALQPRALAMRDLSIRSLRIAMAAGLLSLVSEQAVVWPRSYSAPPTAKKSVLDLVKAAEKLGHWTSEMSLFEVAAILKVDL